MVSAMGFNKRIEHVYGIDIAHVQLISPGYQYEFADNQYTKITIFISRSDGQSDYRCITNIDQMKPQSCTIC